MVDNVQLRPSLAAEANKLCHLHAVFTCGDDTRTPIYMGHTLLDRPSALAQPFLRERSRLSRSYRHRPTDRLMHLVAGGRACVQYVVCVRAGIVRSFMCHAAVANSGEQEHQRRRPLAATNVDDDGGGGRGQQQQQLMPGAGEPVTETAAAPWQSSRQAREMSAMVAALATVVAGSEPPPPAAKGPAQAQAQDASMDEAWWPYEDLQVTEPASPARFVLHGKSSAKKQNRPGSGAGRSLPAIIVWLLL